MSWPPRKDVKGFWVPGTFSEGYDTTPPELRPIQELNVGQARAFTPVGGQKAKRPGILTLLKLGLKASTAFKLASFLVRSRLKPERAWEKVSLQPLVNLDFFEKLYRRHRPDFATFHANHVAHYQHRYWRAHDSTPFLTKSTDEEVRKYGGAMEYGYGVADDVLKRVWALADENTVVVIASGLGAKPYVVEDFAEGRAIVRLLDVNQVVELLGVKGSCELFSVMAPQWNIKIPDPAKRAHAEKVLRSSWYREPGTRLFAYEIAGDTICFNIFQKNLKPLDMDATCCFPDAGGRTMKLGELCATKDATPKEGQHDRPGVAIFRGAGIKPGARAGECSNLDLAPTILHLLGLPIPPHMKGRVLEEVLEAPPSANVTPRPARAAQPRPEPEAVPV